MSAAGADLVGKRQEAAQPPGSLASGIEQAERVAEQVGIILTTQL